MLQTLKVVAGAVHRVMSVVSPTAGLHVGLETADLPQIYGLAAMLLRFAGGLPTL